MGRVTRADAARELEINKSTLTRWIQKHPALLGEDDLVDLEEVRAHRDQVANPKLQTRGAAEKAGSGKGSAPVSGLNDHRARGEAAKAVTAELDLAARLKMTLVREDVESQIADAGAVLKQAAVELARDRAEALARIEDPRAMERALEELMRALLDKGARLLMVSVQRVSADDDAA